MGRWSKSSGITQKTIQQMVQSNGGVFIKVIFQTDVQVDQSINYAVCPKDVECKKNLNKWKISLNKKFKIDIVTVKFIKDCIKVCL